MLKIPNEIYQILSMRIILRRPSVDTKLDCGLDYGGSNEVQGAEIHNKLWSPKQKNN
jgi:hypothetical protein